MIETNALPLHQTANHYDKKMKWTHIKIKADIICRTVLYIAIFGYMQDGNLREPKPNANLKPNPNCNSRT